MQFICYAASLTSGFSLLRLLERETISKFAPVYLGRHFQRKPGAVMYAPTPLFGLLWFWREEQNSEFPKTFFGGYLFAFVEYLCNCNLKIKTKYQK